MTDIDKPAITRSERRRLARENAISRRLTNPSASDGADESLEYRPIPGLPDYYRACSDGTVWTCARTSWRRIKFTSQQDGYLKVRLRLDDRKSRCVTWRVHRVILVTFVGPRPEGFEARHLNGNKYDNRLDNLSWGTQEQNFEDRRRHGTVVTRDTSPSRKLTEELVRSAIIEFNSGAMIKDIAAKIGIDPSHMSKILRGREWEGVADAPLAGKDARARGAQMREARKRSGR